MNKVSDWASESCRTIGNGDLFLTGAVIGFSTFISGLTIGDTVWYSIKDGLNRETGLGKLIGLNVIERSDVKATLVTGVFDNTTPGPIQLSGNSVVSITFTAEAFYTMESSFGNPPADAMIIERDVDGATRWIDPGTVIGQAGPQGPQGIQGPAGAGTDIQGQADVALIKTIDASAIGEAWVSSSTGTDSNGAPVAVGEVLRAINTGNPTTWVNIGFFTGPQGVQGPQGAVGPVGSQGIQGSAGAKGDKGDQGTAGLGTNILGKNLVDGIKATTAIAVGDAYVSTDAGTDSHGSPVAIDDVLRAIDTLNPSTWVNIGAIKGPKGDAGTAGSTGPQGPKGDTGVQGAAGVAGPQGPKGDKGDAGEDAEFLNILGHKPAADILNETSAKIGNAWVSTTNGVDSDGNSVAPNDVMRSSDIAVPSHWVNVGPISTTVYDDGSFRIQNTADKTKKIAFNVSAVASSATRTITMPNADVDLGDLANKVDNSRVLTDVPSGALFTDTIYDDTALTSRVTTNESDISATEQATSINTANISTNTTSINGKENSLGSPASNAMILHSQADGTRSWGNIQWGQIGGVLSAQTDLNTELNSKATLQGNTFIKPQLLNADGGDISSVGNITLNLDNFSTYTISSAGAITLDNPTVTSGVRDKVRSGFIHVDTAVTTLAFGSSWIFNSNSLPPGAKEGIIFFTVYSDTYIVCDWWEKA